MSGLIIVNHDVSQIRLRTHRFGRHGPKPDTEHERPRIRGHRVQPYRTEGGRVPQQRRQRHEHRRRPLAQGTGRLVEETTPGHDARQRYVETSVESQTDTKLAKSYLLSARKPEVRCHGMA